MYIGNLVSAASWYADVAVAAFLLLFVLAGALRGFGKSTKGFFVFVFVVCISLLLTGMTQTAAVEGSLGKSISEGIGSASEGWGVAFNSPVYTDDGENYSILVNDELVPLGGSDFGVKGSLAAFIAKSFHVEDGQSVAGAAVASVTNICVAAILLLIFVVGITLVFFIVRRLVTPLATSASSAVKVVDRVLGALFSLLVGLVFCWIVFAIIDALGDKAIAADEYLRNASLARVLYENNPVASVFCKIFGS